MRLACSWSLHAGRDAVIAANFYGTPGGAALRNVDGSFYDFDAERFDGTAQRTTLAAAAGRLGRPRRGRLGAPAGRRRSASTRRSSGWSQVAAVLDAIYGR